MLVGYNTNISYKDQVYHIQTEDSGQSNPVIVTLLYSRGAILASRKTGYSHILTDSDCQEKVRKMMKIQHKVMIKELLSGKYTGEYKGDIEKEADAEVVAKEDSQQTEPGEIAKEIADTPEAKAGVRSQMTKSLDDVLLNYILKRKNE